MQATPGILQVASHPSTTMHRFCLTSLMVWQQVHSARRMHFIGPKDEVWEGGCGYKPNRDPLIAAPVEMVHNPESVSNTEANVGQYEWVIGDKANALRDNLMTFITEDTLQNLVQFNTEALGLASVYKPELAQ